MSGNAALNVTRVGARVALASLLGVWLAGCSSDTTRLADPFANPFSTASNDQGAPAHHVASNAPAQSNANYAAAAHPSPVAVSALPAPAPATTATIAKTTPTQPVGGSASGWRAAGGSPIVVADGESLEVISRRYGVPASALLQANGFTTASQVHGGVRLIVPVYEANGKAASAEGAHAKVLAKSVEDDAQDDAPARKLHDKSVKADEKAKHKDREDDAQDDTSSRKSHDKSAKADEKDKDKSAKSEEKDSKSAHDKLAQEKSSHDKKKSEEADAKPSSKPTADAKAGKPGDIAKADIAPPPAAQNKKKPAADPAPTGSVHAEDPAPGPALTGNQADAAGVSPEFRWPARGRIIQGFKAGGNDGINIAVPEGTSVKAAESGVVAYAGSELKGYGNLVLIRHPNGFVSAYANNGELDVKRGDSVKRGQTIAKSGQSGNVSSPQLHFELRKGSTPVDPTSFLAGL
jgi:murein DD-endopeptidase MepM/ murein hydrolase activator NlpD